MDSVHVLVCEKNEWKWAAAGDVTGDKPAIMARHSTCLIPAGKKVVCFGGIGKDGTRNDDLRFLSAQNIAKMDWMFIPKEEPEVEAQAEADAPADESQTSAPVEEPAPEQTTADKV